jgi:hypothetical protein
MDIWKTCTVVAIRKFLFKTEVNKAMFLIEIVHPIASNKLGFICCLS